MAAAVLVGLVGVDESPTLGHRGVLQVAEMDAHSTLAPIATKCLSVCQLRPGQPPRFAIHSGRRIHPLTGRPIMARLLTLRETDGGDEGEGNGDGEPSEPTA